MTDILIRGAALYGDEARDVRVAGGRIAEIAEGLEPRDGERVIEAEGMILLPGLVDLHVHFREPGGEAAETVLTGSQAAAIGGFTTVFPMANTSPCQDTSGVVEAVRALGEEAGYCDVRPNGAVTVGLAGERLADIGAMANSKARVRVFSDDGHCVADPLLMRRALEYVKSFDGVVAQHAQEPRLTIGAQMNEGQVSAELGLGGWPWVAETAIIARDVLLAEHVGARIHVCHLSTRASVDIVRWAKARGVQVTAEVTPHHLVLTEERVRGYDARFKVNPPLRTDDDVEALRDAVADGTIDIVATDHAPHTVDAKETEWDCAAMGMLGLEASLRVAHESLVATGRIGWRDVARIMSEAPARIGRADLAGRPLAEGEPADLCLYDPRPRAPFAAGDLRSKSANSPYLGMELPGRVVATIFRGEPTVLDGELVPAVQVARAARHRREAEQDDAQDAGEARA